MTRSLVLDRLAAQAANNAATATRMGSVLAPKTTPAAASADRLPALTGQVLTDYLNVIGMVPDGFYALRRNDGELTFLEVVTQGNRNWIRTLVGAPGEWRRIRMSYPLMVLAARHLARDPQAASHLFADEAHGCMRCGSPLSDPASRARRLGPKCARKG